MVDQPLDEDEDDQQTPESQGDLQVGRRLQVASRPQPAHRDAGTTDVALSRRHCRGRQGSRGRQDRSPASRPGQLSPLTTRAPRRRAVRAAPITEGGHARPVRLPAPLPGHVVVATGATEGFTRTVLAGNSRRRRQRLGVGSPARCRRRPRRRGRCSRGRRLGRGARTGPGEAVGRPSGPRGQGRLGRVGMRSGRAVIHPHSCCCPLPVGRYRGRGRGGRDTSGRGRRSVDGCSRNLGAVGDRWRHRLNRRRRQRWGTVAGQGARSGHRSGGSGRP